MGKPRMTRADKWKVRPSTSKYWAMKDALVLAAKKQNFELYGSFAITFHIKTPKSWGKKKTELMLGTPHTQKPDLDNLIKGTIDSLLSEDCGVWSIFAMKYWADENKICIKNLT